MVARKASRRAPVAVDDEQRCRLIEDCAFFRAERFREVEPGTVRAQDRDAAAAAIDAVLGAKRGRRRKR